MLARFKPQYATPLAILAGCLIIAGVVYYQLSKVVIPAAVPGAATSTMVGPSGLPMLPMPYLIPAPPLPPMLAELKMATGTIAGVEVTGYVLSGVASINRSATTTPFPEVSTDESLDPATMRIVSTDPFVLVQKSDGVHVEYVNASGIVAPSASEEVKRAALPLLLPGGVLFNDQYGNRRVWGLGDGGRIDGLPATGALRFATSSTRYLVGDHGVYFLTYHASIQQQGSDFTVTRVPAADPATFTVLYTDANFARDAALYFMNGEVLTDLSPASAPPIAEGYLGVLGDATYLYQVEVKTDPSEASNGRRYLDKGTLTKRSRASIYYRSLGNVDTQAGEYTNYVFKGGAIWYGSMKVAGADPDTFELVVGLTGIYPFKWRPGYSYARDAHAVYYQGVAIPGADPATFLPVAENTAYGADTAHVFYQGTEIPGADPATFKPLWTQPYEGCSLGTYAKDTAHVFYQDKPVVGADPDTFKALLSGYGRDEHGIYYQGVLHPEIDPASFTEPECNYG